MDVEKQREIQRLAIQLVGGPRRASIRAAVSGALALIDTVSADLETMRDHLEYLEGAFTGLPAEKSGVENHGK